MKKLLFLEYKFRDFTDQELLAPEPTGVMAAFEKLNKARVEQIKKLKLNFGVSISLVSGDSCPANEVTNNRVKKQISQALQFNPDVVWFDHLRFPGKWEVEGIKTIYKPHKECKYCKNLNRKEYITEWAKKVVQFMPSKVLTGYFAVPYKCHIEDNLTDNFGQDHQQLGNIFNYVSPMLYHRMIDKEVDHVHEYVNYLSGLGITSKIIPIIQLKDMPDDLPDRLSIDEIQEAVEQAAKPPSKGVAIFSWDQAIEKGKLEPVSKILRKL